MRIEIKNAIKHFGKVQALRGVNLDVPTGGRVALVGPNGSGKSTLIRTLLGLVDCDGVVLLDGRSPYDDRVEVASRLAYVPQIAPALSATVDEIVRLVVYTRRMEVKPVAEIAALFGLDLPALSAQVFKSLSGGMKQKLLLALAFAAKPRLMVLDEPTASLDARSRDQFFALCSGLDTDVTLLLCSHRVEELRQLATRVIAMEEGRITFDGAASDFLAGALKDVVTGEVRHV